MNQNMTSPYHPRANGLDKRFNQTLINTIAKHVQEDRELWDKKISKLVYDYNTAVHNFVESCTTVLIIMFITNILVSVNCSPFRLCLGDVDDCLWM